jgi:hypothetical protein
MPFRELALMMEAVRTSETSSTKLHGAISQKTAIFSTIKFTQTATFKSGVLNKQSIKIITTQPRNRWEANVNTGKCPAQ